MGNPIALADLPEPYGSMFGFLHDLWEQADLMREECNRDAILLGVIDELQSRLVGLALVIHAAAGSERTVP